MNRPDALAVEVRRALDGCDGPGVVAVSGGPDSVALLRAMLQVRDGAAPLVIAHLNHQLRGPESDADEAFVRDLHARLAVGRETALFLRVQRLDVANRAEGGNLEGVARRLRYDWLTAVAKEVGAGWVATGHTADDQAETVLHRLLRGTGLKGLSGIPARRPLAPGVQVVRPLLRVRRSAVLAFLEALRQEYCRDSSNADRRYTRNRLRHDLLPLLAAQYNPAVATVLCQLAEQAAEVQHAEEAAAAALLATAERPRAGDWIILDRPGLEAAPRHRLRELWRLVWRREGWPQGAMGFPDWDRAAAVALGEAVAVDLPGRVRVRRRGRVVRAGRLA